MTQIGRMFEQEKMEAVNNAIEETRQDDLFRFAAQQANMSIEDFCKAMEEHGYRVPQLA